MFNDADRETRIAITQVGDFVGFRIYDASGTDRLALVLVGKGGAGLVLMDAGGDPFWSIP